MGTLKELKKLVPSGFKDAGTEKQPGYVIVRATKVCPATSSMLQKLAAGYTEVRVWFVVEAEEDTILFRGAIDKQEESADGLDYEWVNAIRSSFNTFEEWHSWTKSFAVLQ